METSYLITDCAFWMALALVGGAAATNRSRGVRAGRQAT